MSLSRHPELDRARYDMRSVLTMTAGDGDVWGWAMDAAFAVCDLMSLAGIEVPAELDYSPSPALDWPGDEDGNDTLRELITVWSNYPPQTSDEALTYWAQVLSRYLDLPAVRELSY